MKEINLRHSLKVADYGDSEANWGVVVDAQLVEWANSLLCRAIGVGTFDGSYTFMLEECIAWMSHMLRNDVEATLLSIDYVKQDENHVYMKDSKKLFIHRSYFELASDISQILKGRGIKVNIDTVCDLAMLNYIDVVMCQFNPVTNRSTSPSGIIIEGDRIHSEDREEFKKLQNAAVSRIVQVRPELGKTRLQANSIGE